MQFKAIIFLLFPIIFCNKKLSTSQESDLHLYTNIMCTNLPIDTAQPLKTIIHFLKWYEQNESIKSRSIIKGGGKDSSTFYSVDFKVADQYLFELRESNFLSDKFLNDLYSYIKRCDSNLKQYPQNDFIAQGFELDLITKLMDDVDLIENIDSYQVVFLKKTTKKAFVKLKFGTALEIPFHLTRYGNTWKIDSINGHFPEQVAHY